MADQDPLDNFRLQQVYDCFLDPYDWLRIQTNRLIFLLHFTRTS